MAVNNSRYDEILAQIRASAEAQKKADKAASDASYATQIKNTQDTYQTQIDRAEHAYDEQLSQANVQRIINERQIAESMANMGLTDSGLNRTQQTAVQLSHANAANKISLAKQQAVDTLAQALAQQVATLQTAQEQAGAQIDSAYEKNAQTQATRMYNKEVDAEADVQKQYIKSQQSVAEKQLAAQQTQEKNAATAMNNLYKVMEGTTSDTSKRLQLQGYYNQYGGSGIFYQMLDEYGYELRDTGEIVKGKLEGKTVTNTAGSGTEYISKDGKERYYKINAAGITLKDIAAETGIDYNELARLNRAWIRKTIPTGTQILLETLNY